jgi:hypothetical protein
VRPVTAEIREHLQWCVRQHAFRNLLKLWLAPSADDEDLQCRIRTGLPELHQAQGRAQVLHEILTEAERAEGGQ